MRKFWLNNEELTADEGKLYRVLCEAHAKCVWRENCSTMALQQAGFGSKHLPSALIAALATLGETHGPVEEAWEFIESYGHMAMLYSKHGLDTKQKVPGFGNSFIKGRIDDAFLLVDQTLQASFPRSHARLREITEALHARGKHIYPNPAAYTATVALALGMPKHLSPLLFVLGRLESWGDLFHRVMTSKPEQKERVA